MLLLLVAWLAAALLRLAERFSQFASLVLERAIAQAHSTAYGLLYALLGRTGRRSEGSQLRAAHVQAQRRGQPQESSAEDFHMQQASHRSHPWQLPYGGSKASGRAWWDPSKGSAVVVWAAGDQALSQSLALSLAARTSTRVPSKAGQPPYTVIVLIPSATEGLADLIGSWAKVKAVATSERGERGSESGCSNSSASAASGDAEVEQARYVSWPFANADSSAAGSPDSSAKRHGKRRALSIGGWSAGDVVGYGIGMLKGLRVGQARTRGVGAIIPVVADTSTPAGLGYAQSTIQDYCLSHDLLLRGLVIVPSIMTSNPASSRAPGGDTRDARPEHDSSLPLQARQGHASLLPQRQTPPKSTSLATKALLHSSHVTDAALSSDVSETMNVIAALHPALHSDGGRIIGLLPSAWRGDDARNALARLVAALSRDGTVTSPASRAQCTFNTRRDELDALEYAVTRNAVLAMWEQLDAMLGDGGISVSRVHMAPLVRAEAEAEAWTRAHQVHETKGSVMGWHSGLRGVRALSRSAAALLHTLLYPVDPSPFAQAMAQLQAAAAAAGKGVERHGAGDQGTSPLHSSTSTSTSSAHPSLHSPTMTATAVAPPLLSDAVRNLLARSVPRRHMCIGLGPRLEEAWACVPGHESLQNWLGAALF